MDLSILYRGSLSSCNYGCHYCPFAKRDETFDELEKDRGELSRFMAWIANATSHTFGILFTPWGEALIRTWYQRSLIELTRLPQIRRAAIQTNLSCRLDWAEECDNKKLALWCTYHPQETSRESFLKQCRILSAKNIRYSVGVVGLNEYVDEARALRTELPPEVYLWINAYKREGESYYSQETLAAWTAIDPFFTVNNQYHASLGHACRTGSSVLSLNGEGTMTRCHFIKEPIGNIYKPGWESNLVERPCSNNTCGCHIGYVHLNRLGLYDVFGEGVLERVPNRW